MARKKTPDQLRDEARKLMEQAAEEERLRQQKIGELVSAAIEKDFAGFDFAAFKVQATQIWTEGGNGGGTAAPGKKGKDAPVDQGATENPASKSVSAGRA